MNTKKILAVAIVFTAFSVLIALGTWQTQRLQWKEEIIRQLDAEYKKDPNQHIYTIDDLKALEDQNNPILYGSIEGSFIETPILLRPKTKNGKIGAHVIQPFKIRDDVVFVNRGWVAEEDTNNIALSHSKETIIISGIFRKPEWNRFTSNNSPSDNMWMKPDIDEMASHFELKKYAPVMLYATSIEDNGILILQDKNWYPRNKHKQYALFWFSSAFILLILVGLKLRQKKS